MVLFVCVWVCVCVCVCVRVCVCVCVHMCVINSACPDFFHLPYNIDRSSLLVKFKLPKNTPDFFPRLALFVTHSSLQFLFKIQIDFALALSVVLFICIDLLLP